MAYNCLFHPLVQKDYDEAYAWYEDQQKGLGEKFIKAVRLKIISITNHPEVFGSRSNKKFREAQVDFFPYQVVYKVKKRAKIIYTSSIHRYSKHPSNKYSKE